MLLRKSALKFHCRKLRQVVNENCDDWDDCLNEVLMNLRNLRLRATGFSPHEMFHTYKFRRCVSEAADEEDDTLLRRIEENDGIDDECRTTIDQFAEVQRSVRNRAEDNIAREKDRQKKSFNLRTLNRGETVNLGNVMLSEDN